MSPVGGAQGHGCAKMSQNWLSPGGMRAPAVWLLFLVFVREHCLKRATMHVQGHDISRCERAWWPRGVEQFVDVLTTRGADLHRRIWSFPCGTDDSRARSGWRKIEIREISALALQSSQARRCAEDTAQSPRLPQTRQAQQESLEAEVWTVTEASEVAPIRMVLDLQPPRHT